MKRLMLTLLMGVPGVVWGCADFLDSELKRLHSPDHVNLCEAYGGQPMLVVNTASRCGYTGQFEGLEALHERFREQGLAVVGFASNEFNQEASTEAEAANVCRVNYGVTFTMIAPSDLTGPDANPVFARLEAQGEAPRWNFHKYVLDSEGNLRASFPSQVAPGDEVLIGAIEDVLNGSE